MTFGEKIRELRKQAGLSQSELGDAVHVTLRTVRGWEVEGRYPKKHITYARLAEVFGCRISSLLEGGGDQSADPGADSLGTDLQVRQIMQELKDIFSGSALSAEEKFALVTEIQMLYMNSKSSR